MGGTVLDPSFHHRTRGKSNVMIGKQRTQKSCQMGGQLESHRIPRKEVRRQPAKYFV